MWHKDLKDKIFKIVSGDQQNRKERQKVDDRKIKMKDPDKELK